MLPKSQLKQVFLYRTKIPSMVALELVTVKRVSTVLGMPSELVTPGLIARLRDSGFDVSSEL